MIYQGFIFTTHARERMSLRSVSADDVVRVLKQPATTKPTDKANTSKFIRTLNGREVHVVATYLEEKKTWLVVSVWVRGEDDKLPLVWVLLTLPFKAVWWVIKLLFRTLFTPKKQQR